ncbi:MAG TPA: 4'-phosphopantetheinyl transferase superfamily protein [Prolixibacteraceae bacterium]|nr:MAG: holo-(acyl carrier protein) synthase 2 [Bacteroidetes bacterium ADurb.Bin123]HNZ68152.1 4'-phosphopantetheinyl transferase superfamily protein [Prolixibacteraceae bacterium]HOC85870.1 4'-phosphopantetheinyl transferase superfamily protein [Prolixibacteraceae bacterium]HOF56599.1 4'-phosphopantetheinyl transferase superfamily protein [Prolixibacteraceae bacterium]HOS00927.1 4'-phosphopantetheinyl transferase superfamily protein [Prolixibacteraceae bacterium]
MPLLEIRDYKSSSVGLWSMTESSWELASRVHLTEKEKTLWRGFSGEHRKKEFLAIRLLLAQMIDEQAEIVYTALSKPLLTGKRKHVSISHSRNLAALILSDYPAGIDTEETLRKVGDIAPRFLSEEELAWTRNSPDPELALIFCWSAKESLYKMIGEKGISFRNQLFLPETKLVTDGSVTAYYRKSGKTAEIELNFFFRENNVITWCVLTTPGI